MYQEFKLVAGHLKERKGRYYVVVSYTDATGKRISREFSTGLPVKGNKKKADDILQRIRRAVGRRNRRHDDALYAVSFRLAGNDARKRGEYDLFLLQHDDQKQGHPVL